QHQHVGGALGEHHPFSAPGRDQGAGCVRGGHGVGVLTSSRGKSVQVVGGVPGRRWFEADLRGLYFGDLVPVVVFDAEVDHGYKITGSGAAAGAEDVLVTAHGGGPVLVVGDTYDLPAGVLQPLFRLDVALGHVGVLVHGSVDKHRDLGAREPVDEVGAGVDLLDEHLSLIRHAMTVLLQKGHEATFQIGVGGKGESLHLIGTGNPLAGGQGLGGGQAQQQVTRSEEHT